MLTANLEIKLEYIKKSKKKSNSQINFKDR